VYVNIFSMKTTEQRLNNIIGQIEGLKKLIKKDTDCITILTQLKAIRSAVGSIMDKVVERQMNDCMSTLSEKDKKLLSKIKTYVGAN
jgi:CsoR family transcriptional regulator, copper-sensing transcriptional repressor